MFFLNELIKTRLLFVEKILTLIFFSQEFVGLKDGPHNSSDLIPQNVAKQERIGGDLAMEIGKKIVLINPFMPNVA